MLTIKLVEVRNCSQQFILKVICFKLDESADSFSNSTSRRVLKSKDRIFLGYLIIKTEMENDELLSPPFSAAKPDARPGTGDRDIWSSVSSRNTGLGHGTVLHTSH